MTLPFALCAIVTLVSSLVILGFSLAAVAAAAGDSRKLALYAAARSIALAALSASAFVTGSSQWLQAAAAAMIIVQGLDTGVGAISKDRLRTLGPAVTALINVATLLWFLLAG